MIDPTAAPPPASVLLPAAPASMSESLAEHLAHFGSIPMAAAVTLDLIDASGLRGRGGAAFPAGIKWRAVAARSSARGVVLVNGVEADPSSGKDRALMTARPHLVLDGALMAARAVGASEIVVAVNRRAIEARTSLAAAIRERREQVGIRLVGVPSRYVAGEETALIHFVNGGAARPTATPPRPFEKGVRGRPTLVHNAETLAWAALIGRRGDAWFRTLGTTTFPGAMLVSVRGAVDRPGVYELPSSATVGQALTLAGERDAQALLLGGYFGQWVHRSEERTLAEVNAGVILALPARSCGLTETARILSFLAGESARQCGPCFNGLPALSSAIGKVAVGRATAADVDHLDRWAGQLSGHRGACHHPDGAVALLLSALRTFEADLRTHVQLGACRGAEAPSILPPAATEDAWR